MLHLAFAAGLRVSELVGRRGRRGRSCDVSSSPSVFELFGVRGRCLPARLFSAGPRGSVAHSEPQRAAGSPTIHAIISRILKDEAQHADLGWWFLDWADLNDNDRADLGREAGAALRSLSTLFARDCSLGSGLGTVDCATFDEPFVAAVERSVVRPLFERGIVVPASDLVTITSIRVGSSA